MIVDLRFIERDGEKILQYRQLEIVGIDEDKAAHVSCQHVYDWRDVPLAKEDLGEGEG